MGDVGDGGDGERGTGDGKGAGLTLRVNPIIAPCIIKSTSQMRKNGIIEINIVDWFRPFRRTKYDRFP